MDNGKEDLLQAPFVPDGVERQLGELPQEITDCDDRQIAAHGGEPASTGCRLPARRWAGSVVQVWRGHCHQNQPRNLSHQPRSEEHTSELQSLMRISYAVFCLKKKKL